MFTFTLSSVFTRLAKASSSTRKMSKICCFCIDHRSGAQVVGLVNICFVILVTVSFISDFVQDPSSFLGVNINGIKLAAVLTSSLIILFLNILLYNGVSRSKRWMVLTWLICYLLMFVFGVGVFIYLLMVIGINGSFNY